MKLKMKSGIICIGIIIGMVSLPISADEGHGNVTKDKKSMGKGHHAGMGKEHMKDMEKFSKVMSGNFAAVMTIMSGLIYDNLSAVEEGSKNLIKHADEISRLKPGVNLKRIDEYKHYASHLKIHAKHMLDAIKHPNPEIMYAHHLGEIVDSCVNCHKTFRAAH